MGRLIEPGRVFHDALGAALSGGTVTAYENGTTTLKATYSDVALSTSNPNPMTLNAAVRLNVEVFGTGSYSIRVADTNGSAVWSEDDVRPALGDDLADYDYDIGLTGSSERTLESRLQDWVSVKDFGAVGDGVTDDYAAFNAALTAATQVYVPDGTYLLSESLEYQQVGNQLLGSGVDQCVLKATHTSGPVVRLKYFFNVLDGVKIDADATRQAGPVGTNWGVLKEAVDSAGQHAKSCRISNIRVVNQPGHGIAWVGSFSAGVLENFDIDECDGHGVLLDNGTATSRTNITRLGGVDIRNGVIQDCVGHAIKAGDDDGSTNQPYRIRLDNVDSFRCAQAAGVRKTAHSWWCYLDTSIITRCAFGGADDDNTTPITGGLFIAGRATEVAFPRFIKNTQPPCNIGDVTADGISTRGVNITNLHVSGMSANADPVVVIDSNAKHCIVTTQQTTEIDSVATPSDASDWRHDLDSYYASEHFFRRLQSSQNRVIADDGFTDIEFDADPTAGFALISSNVEAGEYALVYFRAGTSPECTIMSGSTSATATTGALTGTTGANGDLTISTHTDSKLYIENRTASSRTYGISFLSLIGGNMLPAEMLLAV